MPAAADRRILLQQSERTPFQIVEIESVALVLEEIQAPASMGKGGAQGRHRLRQLFIQPQIDSFSHPLFQPGIILDLQLFDDRLWVGRFPV